MTTATSPAAAATARDPGILLVVSSPSGAGKTTLCLRLISNHPRITFSVSTTTRPRRSTEQEGVHYHFVDEARFAAMIDGGHFAEWAEVHGHRYGTARATIEQNLAAGRDLLFDIDWQGATRLKALYPEETVMVYILPPTLEVLAARLRRRGTETEDVVRRRLAKALDELGHYREYDFLILNDDLDRAEGDLEAVYRSAHLARPRTAPLAEALLVEPPGALQPR
jgi:guanylate kinase